MARTPRPWFRFYVEAMSDRKLRRLTPAQRWLWVAVLAAARQSPIPGFLMVSEREALEDYELADIAGMTLKEVTATLPRFEASGMIHRDEGFGCWVVTAWDSRQFESDAVTERTRKHRSKEQPKERPPERSNGVPRNAPEQSRAELPPTPSPSRNVSPTTERPLPAYRDAADVIAEHRVPPEQVSPMPEKLRRRYTA